MDRLTDKNYKDYNRVSRYSVFPYYYDEKSNKYLYGITSQLEKDIPYVSHIVQQNDTLDSLALYYYNNPTYYWIIADFNNINDPYIQLKKGIKLKIPTFSKVKYKL